jgi:hypothetical protein
MTHEEQTAFVEAYARNVAMVHPDKVASFVESWANGEDMDYSGDYTSIMDALLMWNSAIKWQMGQTHEALTLSLAELHRHAGDTESGERAIEAVEGVLK